MAAGIELIDKYFPKLPPEQREKLAALGPLYKEWNDRINVISRKDIENLYERHILHSLAIATVVRFRTGASILDLGTGGGFPGIPLAIMFPTVQFHLIDGTGKKIRVCQEVIDALGLTNVVAEQRRAEELKGRRFDFVVTRAVARMDKLAAWSLRLIKIRDQRHAIPNGILALKGVGLEEEMAEVGGDSVVETYPLRDVFAEEFFAAKSVIYLQA